VKRQAEPGKSAINLKDSSIPATEKVAAVNQKSHVKARVRPTSPTLNNLSFMSHGKQWAAIESFIAPLAALPPVGPALTATKDDALVVDTDTDGKADPGDTIEYTVNVANGPGTDATGVIFTDTISDSNLTFVGGSVIASAVAVNDTFPQTLVGNVSINSATISYSVVSNDFLGVNPTATITAFDATSAQGGTVTMTTSGANIGQFTYDPPAGFEGTDTFTYTLSDQAGNPSALANRKATVSLTISGMIWFVDNNAGACSSGCDGRLSHPFTTLANFQAVNDGVGNHPADNDNIFLYESSTAYTGPVTLRSNQRLIGQDATASLSTITGLTPPTSSPAFPTMNSGNGTIVKITSAANAINLNSANTTNLIRGLTVGNTTGVGIAGTSFGTLTVADTSITDAGTRTGQALDLTTGTLSATIANLVSSSAVNGVKLTGVNGTLTVGSGALSALTGADFLVSGGAANITFPGTINNVAGRSVDVQGHTGGTILFSGGITDTGTGIFLDTNTGATINFTGGITSNTAGNTAFTATGGGTVSVTGTNTIGATTALTNTALNVQNTTIGASNLNFQSISVNTASNGIVLNNTGASGGLNVTGTGTTDGTGGTIQNITNRGVSAVSTINLTLKNMNFSSTGTTDGASNCGADNTSNTGCNGAIHLQSATNVTIDNINTNGGQYGINGNNVTTFSLANSLIQNQGNGVNEHGVRFLSLFGTSSVTNTTITGSAVDNMRVYNTSGTLNLTVTNSTFSNTSAAFGSAGLNLINVTGGSVTATILGSTFQNNQTVGLLTSFANNSSQNITVTNNGATKSQFLGNNEGIDLGATDNADMTFNINNSNFLNQVAQPINIVTGIQLTSTNALQVNGTISANTIGNASADSGSVGGEGIRLAMQGGSVAAIAVTNNNIQHTDLQGLSVLSRNGSGGSVALTVTGNTVGAPDNNTAFPLGGVPGMFFEAFDNTDGTRTVCLDLRTNTSSFNGAGSSAAGYRLRSDNPGGVFQLEGYSGAGDAASVQTFVQSQNTGTASAFAGTPFLGSAGCASSVMLDLQKSQQDALALNNSQPTNQSEAAVFSILNKTLFTNHASSAGTSTATDKSALQAMALNVPALQLLKSEHNQLAADSIAEAKSDSAFLSSNHSSKAKAQPMAKARAATSPLMPVGPDVTATIPTLPASKNVFIRFRAQIKNPLATPAASVSNQGHVHADGPVDFDTDDPNVAGAANPTVTPLDSADLQLTKTDAPDPVSAGSNITYTLNFKNNGPSAADTLSLTDAVPANTTLVSVTTPAGWTRTDAVAVGGTGTLTFTKATAANQETATFTVVVNVNANVANGSTITNSASVTSTKIDPDSTNNTNITATTTVQTRADLAVTKVDTPDPVIAGNNITYTVNFVNNGPSDAQGVTVTDAVPANTTLVSATTSSAGWARSDAVPAGGTGNVVFSNASVAGGATATFTIVVKVNTSAAAGSTITNNAVAASTTTDPTPGNNTGTATTTVNRQADIEVTKTDSPDPVNAGNNLTYTITLTNHGPSDASTATLTDATPANTTLVSVTTPAGWTRTDAVAAGGTGTISFSKSSVASLETATFTIVVKVSAAAPDASTITNSAVGSSATTDPTPGNNTGTATTTVINQADLAITKSDSPDPVIAGNNITYTLHVQNNGQGDAQSVTVTDAVPANTTFVSVGSLPAGWSRTDAVAVGGTGTISFAKASMANGESADLTLVVKVNANATAGSTISNSAAIASTTPDPTPANNNTGAVTTTVATSADIAVTKTDSPDPVTAGTNLTYTITVTNNGPSDAQSLQLSDALPANTTFVSLTVPAGWTRTDAVAVGGTGTITATATTLAASANSQFTLVVKVDAATPNGTTISNSATVSSTTTDTNSANDTGTATTSVLATLAVTVNTAGDAGDANVGDRICDTDLGTPGDQCTLRAAIEETNAAVTNDTIDFAPALSGSTITLDNALPDINGNLVITGLGANLLTVERSNTAVSGFGIFTIDSGSTASISGLTISGGNSPAGGGGINNAGTLTLKDSTVSGNSAIFGGGIYSVGDLTISNSTFTDNHAVASEGGGIDSEGGTLSIVNSTISGNTAATDGGGLLNCGSSTTTLTNVTITNNRADNDNDNNGAGGGLAQVSSNPITIRNTIVAGNFKGASPSTTADDINGTVDPSSSNNLIGMGGAGGLTSGGATNNQVGVSDARLGPLANNGGPTKTHALLPGSAALDAGDNALVVNPPFSGPPFTDQRGTGFARIVDADDTPDTTATVDIGAFEAQVAVEDIPDTGTNEDTPVSFAFNVSSGVSSSDVTATSSNQTLVPDANISVTGASSPLTLNITPASNKFGSATITVTVTSGSQTMTDTFVLSVTPIADTPSVSNSTTAEDTQTTTGLVISRNAADGSEVSFFKITNIQNGTLFQNDGATLINNGDFITFAQGNLGLKFTPAPNFSGTGSFDIQASTGNNNAGLGGSVITAMIAVGSVNDQPTLDAITPNPLNILEDAGLQTVNLTGISAGGGESQALTVTATSNNTGLIPNPTVSYTSPNATGSLSFTPVANQSGSATITVTVQDNGGTVGGGIDTVTRTFVVNVTGVNDAPSFTKGPNQTVGEDAGAQTVPNWATAISAGPGDSGQAVNFIVTNNTNTALFSAQPAISPTGTLTYTPAANATGAATITITLHDDGGTANGGQDTSAPQTFTITVNAVNDAPSFTKGPNQTVNEDAGAQTVPNWATAISAGPPDESGQAVNFIVTNNTNTALFSAQPAISPTGTLTYTPAANANGAATITIALHDNGGTAGGGQDTSATQTFTITVNAVNDAPTLDPIGNLSINEDAGAQTVNLAGISAGGGESQTLVVTATSNNTGLIPNPTVTYTSPNATGTLSFTPVANQNGSAVITVTVNDGGGTANGGADTVVRTFTVTVNAVNDAPVNNVPGPQGATRNGQLVFSAANSNLISISDIDAGAAAVKVTLTATNGKLTLSGTSGLSFTVGDGTQDVTMTFTGTIANINAALNGLIYEPNNGYDGPATVQITTDDQGNTGSGGAQTDTDTINITVNKGGALGFSSATYTVAESAGSITITVNRVGGSNGTTKVDYTTSNGTATAPQDYTATSGQLTFGNGETTKTFVVPIINDTLNEASETVNLTLSNAQGSGDLGSPTTAVLTITDDDPQPALSINDVSVTEGNSGTVNANFIVTLSAASGQTVTVNYATANGTATAPTDYQAQSSTLTFTPGQTTKTVTVLVNGDTTSEPDENFFVNLSGATNASISDAQGVGTIVSDDSPVIQFSASAYTVAEDALRITVTVNRLGDTSKVATVDYATSDSAGLANCSVVNGIGSSRCDYAVSVGTLRFAANEASKTISIPIVNDVYVEGPENFTITLSHQTGGELGSPTVATITITDNDNGGAPNPMDDNAFFIRQLYIDFLGREPDPPGLRGWLGILNNCAPDDVSCDRIHIAEGFARSDEFAGRGYFIYRIYRASLGRKPDYAEFIPDMAKVSGFLSPQDLEANKQAFVDEFVTRTEFRAKYDSLDNSGYVNALEATALVTLPSKQALIDDLVAGRKTRAQVLRAVIETTEVYTKYVNEAFVVMEYFGFLRRDPDSLYRGWIEQFNHSNVYRLVISGFVFSQEYRQRFGPN
jgi:uncharacterized repeat protein (TIGR01451 family)